MAAKTWDELYGEGAQQASGTYPCKHCGYTGPCEVDLSDLEAIRGMCREELVLAIRANSGKAVVAQLINALLDRIDGKAVQPQAIAIIEQKPNEQITLAETARRLTFIMAKAESELENVTPP